ncbi:MAG: mechanosensitive ion channel family protein [Clostridium sp.]|nr:mechanosensitive ion channel family protein [Clostridium sp.]
MIICWTLREDFYLANYEMNEEILEAFEKENIEIPYNKQDIFLK